MGQVTEIPGGGYKKGDIRRLLRVAMAVAELEAPTLNNIARATGHHKQTILDDIKRLQEQLGVTIMHVDSEYRATDLGPVLSSAECITQFLATSTADTKVDHDA
jgi:hypothetical protein